MYGSSMAHHGPGPAHPATARHRLSPSASRRTRRSPAPRWRRCACVGGRGPLRNVVLDRQLMSLSGLESALGGHRVADDAYAAVVSAMSDVSKSWQVPPDFGVVAGLRRAVVPDQTAAGILTASLPTLLLGAQGLVDSTDGLEPGQSVTRDVGSSGKMSGSIGAVQFDASQDVSAGGLNSTMKIHIEVSPCPAGDRRFAAKDSASAGISTADGEYGASYSMESNVTGQVGDDASWSAPIGKRKPPPEQSAITLRIAST